MGDPADAWVGRFDSEVGVKNLSCGIGDLLLTENNQRG